MVGPIISLVFIAIVARLLLRKYNPQAVLLLAGLFMLGLANALGFAPLELAKPTGSTFLDLFAAIQESFSKTNAGVGLMIMAIGGFVAYTDKIGASNVLVHYAMKPLIIFKSRPYVAASLVIPIGQVLFVAIPSAAGLGLLLMASLYPILTNLGVSRVSAVSVITASTVFGIGPACATTASAIEILNMDAIIYFLKYQIPLVWPLSLFMMVIYFFVNRHYDKKMPDDKKATTVVSKEQPLAPAIYALLPILPIVLLMVFSDLFQFFNTPIVLDTTTVMFISFFVALAFEAIRHRDFSAVTQSFGIFWTGMANIFKSVVTLIITADIFAKGLIGLGFIDGLLFISTESGMGAIGLGMVMALMIFLASMLMGSGNAAFFAFGPLVPDMATKIGLSTTAMLLPMQLAASMGRAVSPVSGVLIATAEIAGLTSMDIVKRNIIPLFGTLVFLLITHFLL
ncbi:MAG: C4-dicarboxylate transporter DcuC [Schleiferiaceae bacterium]|nr:C4-dicarboxylate transporter DcuC [Schleiferiaceae bacterium]